ncbi:MAG: ABC transporter ATP-binding protein, partial [Planctomycetota bacterium]
MTLRGQRLEVHHGARTVLAGVDLEVKEGELVLLAGRNGAGKSTLLRVLLSAQSPDAGEVVLDGRSITSWEPRARARRIAFVPQATEMPFEFTGRELVAMARHPHRGAMQPETAADRGAIACSLEVVDALSFCDRPVTTLSGGELRRIAIARALATEAQLLLLDEPLTNLDLEHAVQLCDLLRLLADQGRGLLVAAHDLNLLAPVAHRVVLLHEGRVHEDGPPEIVLGPENIETVFGVQAHAPTGYFPR